MRVDVFHNILWSKYKAGVFSEMYRLAGEYGISADFYQIAESDADRMTLSNVDLSRHRYPFTLLFKGAYSHIPKAKLASTLFLRTYRSDADLILLPGFSELVHWGMLFGALLSRKKRAVFCDSTLRDRPQSRFKGILKRLYFGLCNGYFTYGERGREYLIHYGANPAMVFQRVQAAALPNGYAAEDTRQARTSAAHVPDGPVFLYVGRLSAEKSIDVLLRAFPTVVARLPDATIRIVGAGPQKDELIRLRDELGLARSVEFVGNLDLDALAAEYALATCFVLPSRSEPWGLVVNEALHFGCPVVVSDSCGCVPELVMEGQTGVSFRAGDIEGLSLRLVEAASMFEDASKTADDCLRVIADYTPERSARQTLEGCNRIMAARA
jgi:glycosyltransferase involved in cell wall biosynthesis